MEKELLYELMIEDDATDEVFAVSFVESPAIERDFVFMSKEVKFASIDDEKMLVAGPILIPNKKILRMDGEGKPYYVFFTPETVEKLARKFLAKKYNDSVTVEHDKKVGNVHLVESWIIEQSSKDKSNIYGYTLPKGTWFGIYDVKGNPKVWEKVKNGTFKGFSVEALVEHKVSNVKLSLEKNIDELNDDEAEIVLSKIKAMIKKDKRYGKGQRIEMESYSDYGSGISNNAKKGIDLNEKNGNKCATQVGKVRAQQLANGEPISVETIKRMFSYLSRAETYYDSADSTSDCGYISFLLWGGKAGLGWSRNKLRELGLLEETEVQPSVTSTYPGEVAKKKKQKMAIEKPNVNVFGYHTRYFEMCPTASELFEHLITMKVDEETIGMIRSAAQIADNVFRKEKEVITAGVASQHDYEEVVLLVEDFKDLMGEIDEEVGMNHDVSFMDNHIMKVKEYYNV